VNGAFAVTGLGVVAGGLFVSWIIGHFAAGSHGFDWNAATAAATAYGTLALGAATGWLGWQARTEGTAVAAQVEIGQRQLVEMVQTFASVRAGSPTPLR
jgi:hypothetical protein